MHTIPIHIHVYTYIYRISQPLHPRSRSSVFALKYRGEYTRFTRRRLPLVRDPSVTSGPSPARLLPCARKSQSSAHLPPSARGRIGAFYYSREIFSSPFVGPANLKTASQHDSSVPAACCAKINVIFSKKKNLSLRTNTRTYV